jgi:hypothetical protein
VLEEEWLLIRPLNIFFFLVDVVGQHATAAMDFWKKRGRQDAGGSTKPGSSKRQRALADSSWTEDSEVFAAAGSRYHKNAVSLAERRRPLAERGRPLAEHGRPDQRITKTRSPLRGRHDL